MSSKYQKALDWAYHHGTQIEGDQHQFYLDSNNVSTVSVGVAGIVKDGKWTAKSDLATKLETAGVNLSVNQKQALTTAMNTMAKELNKSQPNQSVVNQANGSINSISLTSAQSRALFEAEFKDHYIKTRNDLDKNIFDGLEPERQAAFAMQHYQTPTRVKNASYDVKNALQKGDYNAAANEIEQIGRDVNDPLRAQSLAATIRDPELSGKGILTNADGGLEKFAQRYGVTQHYGSKKIATNELHRLNPDLVGEDGSVRAGVALNLPDFAIEARDVYAAYAEQGISRVEADKHWSELGNHQTLSYSYALHGLTKDEAHAVDLAKQDKDLRGHNFSGPEMIAGTRYAQEMARSGDEAKALQKAREGLAEARTYSGPSQDISPEDTMSIPDLRAQLERNMAILQQRRNLLEDTFSLSVPANASPEVNSVTIRGVPEGASFSAGTTNQPATKTVNVRFGDTLSGLAVKHGTTVNAFMRANPQIKNADKIQADTQLSMPKETVSLKDVETAIRGFMNTPVYRDLKTPQAHETVQSAFESLTQREEREKAERAAAAQQKATEAKARQDAFDRIEADRQASLQAQQKEEQALHAERAKEEQAHEKQHTKQLAREEAGLPELDGTYDVGVAKVDRLGENAVSESMPKDVFGQRLGLSPENLAAAAKKRNAQANAPQAERSQGSGQNNSARTTPRTENYSGPGSPGGYDANGNYQSGRNKNGTRTGGSTLDDDDREIGAYGQFTRDVVGRKNADGTSSSSNTRVICTELVRQGRMAPSLQRLDIAYTLKKLSPITVRGYHFWAVPYVHLMKRSALATAVIDPFATWRALEIAYQMGDRDKPHFRGKLVRGVMEPLCWAIGWVLSMDRGQEGKACIGRV